MLLCRAPADLYYIEPTVPTVDGPGDDEEMKPIEDKEVEPAAPKLEVIPEPEPKTTALPPVPITLAPARKVLPSLAALNGYCVVGLKQRQFNVALSQFSSEFEDHTYHFASSQAKAEFDSSPAQYAPAYGGVDPVVWLERHEMVEGKYLREFEGRFYLFSEKEKWETFKSTPQRFVLRKTKSQDLVSK